ncbi:unnamed protein product [Phytophthora fragariaefolia]|uniref:Unnamed protein product n=1 Tax=Phytophthora fragariaefolia TaxID=1490495 RepID=A0A9W6Y541_9STRA|nr:unnamed protein product [Phytophthora fragariaefolia]
MVPELEVAAPDDAEEVEEAEVPADDEVELVADDDVEDKELLDVAVLHESAAEGAGPARHVRRASNDNNEEEAQQEDA